MGAMLAVDGLGREGGGGEIQRPENHSSCVKVYTPGGEDAIDLGPVAGKVAGRLWDAPAEDEGAALGSSHVVEAGTGVEVMAAAAASSNGGTLAAAAVGKSVTADPDYQVRT